MDVGQFQPVTTAASGAEDDDNDDDDEVSAVMELNDETGAFEYTLYSLTSPPFIKLYVPGMKTFCVNNDNVDHDKIVADSAIF